MPRPENQDVGNNQENGTTCNDYGIQVRATEEDIDITRQNLLSQSEQRDLKDAEANKAQTSQDTYKDIMPKLLNPAKNFNTTQQ